jgi:hypothetical protein
MQQQLQARYDQSSSPVEQGQILAQMDKLSLGGANGKTSGVFNSSAEKSDYTVTAPDGTFAFMQFRDSLRTGGAIRSFVNNSNMNAALQAPADAGDEIIVTAQRGPDVSFSLDIVDMIRLYREIAAVAQANQQAIQDIFFSLTPRIYVDGGRLSQTTNGYIFVDSNGDGQYDLLFRTINGQPYVTNNGRNYSYTDDTPPVQGRTLTIPLG